MYVKSLYPDPPPLPNVNAHYFFFKRPDQAEWPNYTIYIDPATDARVMYRDFIRNIEDLSTGLAAPVSQGGMGLEGWEEGVGADEVAKPGQTGGKEIVGIISQNSSEYITLVHACLRIAVPFALISSYSTAFELKHALSLSKATRLFVGPQFVKIARAAAAEAGIPQDRIYLLQGGAPLRPRAKVVKGKAKQSFWGIIEDVRERKLPTVDIRPATENALAYLVFSSGTSGLPKAVMISHGNLMFSLGQSIVMQQSALEVYTHPPPVNPEGIPVSLAFLPLHHTYGLHTYSFRSSLAPTTYVILSQWNIDIALKAVPKYKVSALGLIPSVVHQLVNHPGIENVDFSSVQSVISGAAYLPPELGDKMAKLIPSKALFTVGYGMSEATIAAISVPIDGALKGKLRKIHGSTGYLIPGMEAMLFKDENSVPSGTHSGEAGCKVNEPGELWLKSKNIALGYWNNPKANRETFVGGWLRTGDRFRCDEGGCFWFADRVKDTLKVSGAQVSPVEIEDCLLAHPLQLITDATVAGVSGGRTDDEKVPRAWIVLSDLGASKEWGKAKVIGELEKWHQENLSKYKWLRGGIEVVDSIPKSPTGKTLRRVLQDRYEKHAKKYGRRVKSKL